MADREVKRKEKREGGDSLVKIAKSNRRRGRSKKALKFLQQNEVKRNGPNGLVMAWIISNGT